MDETLKCSCNLSFKYLSWRISVEHQCNWHIFWPVRCSRKSKLVFFDPLFCLTWSCIRTKLPRRTTLIPRNRTRVSCIPPVCKSDMLSHTFPVSHKSCEDDYCAWGDLETMLPPTKGQPVPESNIISTRIKKNKRLERLQSLSSYRRRSVIESYT